jgi:antagonist of KipI
MSLRVIKAGIQDTIQDIGRIGYQWLGINPGGVMDQFSASIVNMLVGNPVNEAVIEMHFPAAAFLFEQDAMIAIGGADFSPTINGEIVPLWHPIIVNQNSVLQFEQLRSGARCYLAIRKGMEIKSWLNSKSTNLKAAAGGFHGRALQRGDSIGYQKQYVLSALLLDKELSVLPWTADIRWEPSPYLNYFSILRGNEWNWLDKSSQDNLAKEEFHILQASDRMGYRMDGGALSFTNKSELVSAAVSFGTIQLLPEGQLIALMSDHQTTGGYPRIAHVISAQLPRLAQCRPGDKINFQLMDLATAEKLYLLQQQHLLQLQNACKFRLEQYMA